MAALPDTTTRGLADSRTLARFAPLLAAALALLGILLAHVETVRSIVAIWQRSATFTHGFAVVPIAIWLAWRDRAVLARVPARPWWPALAGVALAALLWLAMALADVQVLRQYALVFMLQAALLAVVGLRVVRTVLLPVLFLLFAVPAGEILLPTLIDWTADFTVSALRASGVPVFREANHFVIPSGSWSVVEACSGLRYLIASFMIGVVFAAVSYRSLWRKLAFITISIAVPIVANWLRAYMIVMIGHLSDNRLAVGVDHLIYGWVFFGIVMALLFWIGSIWTERAPVDAGPVAAPGARPPAPARHSAGAYYVAAAATIALAAAVLPVRAMLQPPPAAPPILAPLSPPAGYVAAERLPGDFAPSFQNPTSTLRQGFVRDGVPVGLQLTLYANQAKGRELVTSSNQLVRPDDDVWREIARDTVAVRYAGREVAAGRSVASGARDRLEIVWLYWIDGRVTADPIVAKALLAFARLRGHEDTGVHIAVFAPEGRDAARAAFVALAPVIEASLRTAKAAQP